MGVNKVVLGNRTLIDLTAVTVTPEVLLEGYTAYDASGNLITGTYKQSSYTNLADPSSAEWKDGYRITSTGIAAQAGKTVCNPVSVAIGDVIRVKGVSFIANADRYQITGVNSGGTTTFGRDYISRLPNSALNYTMDGDVYVFTVLDQNIVTDGELCFSFNTPSDPSVVIITRNEEIT